LARAAVFELVATSEGAVLVWAPPRVCERGLQVQRLATDGSLQNATSIAVCPAGAAVESSVFELSAAAGGGRLGVAFIMQQAGQARVLATHGSDAADTFAPVVPLGAAEPASSIERSRLWLSASESGQLRVAWQAPRAACVGSHGTCAPVIAEPLPPAVDAASRRTDTREIPWPCERLLVGSTWTLGVWYDAFCALDRTGQEPTTQVYAIRPEIFYAEAVAALTDCGALGVSPSRAGAAVWGSCADGLRVHLIAPEGRRQVIHDVKRALTCEGGRPVLRIQGRSAQEAMPLDGPRDRLELWLPPELAPQGSRVTFTGRRLLVAATQGGRLFVKSHRCEGQRLVSDTSPML
jgi:hypothetical protein